MANKLKNNTKIFTALLSIIFLLIISTVVFAGEDNQKILNKNQDELLSQTTEPPFVGDVIKHIDTPVMKMQEMDTSDLVAFDIELGKIKIGKYSYDEFTDRYMESFSNGDTTVTFDRDGKLVSITNFATSKNEENKSLAPNLTSNSLSGKILTEKSYMPNKEELKEENSIIQIVKEHIEENLLDSNYVLVEDIPFDEDYWSLIWQEKTNDDILNPYCAIEVIIDLNKDTVASFKRFEIKPDSTSIKISEDEAALFAKEYLNNIMTTNLKTSSQKNDNNIKTDLIMDSINLAIVQPVNVLEGEVEPIDSKVYFAYCVSFNDGQISVNVDVENGNTWLGYQ